MLTKEALTLLSINNYLKSNIRANKKILILISCGLDSTVLFDLLSKSKYFNKKNIYYLIFDHQKRSEGKYEIKQFIKFYKLEKKNLFIKILSLKDKLKGFQKKSRSFRYDFIVKFSKERDIEDIFVGHHLDDLNETFFLRKIQQSSAPGLSNIFLRKYNDLKLHRPLMKYSKKQIKSYANKNNLIWFEDRSNLELGYTRNKIRNFLYSKNLFKRINQERLVFSEIVNTHSLHNNFFIRKQNKFFEIDKQKFNRLNENLKFFTVQSFYYEYRHLLKKQIRDENIKNFIKKLNAQNITSKEIPVFSGKIGVFNKKTCINLT